MCGMAAFHDVQSVFIWCPHHVCGPYHVCGPDCSSEPLQFQYLEMRDDTVFPLSPACKNDAGFVVVELKERLLHRVKMIIKD